MSGKKAKALRKEVKKIAQDRFQDWMPNLPIAACPSCGMAHWFITLDADPPEHTEIVTILCSNRQCMMQIGVGFKINPSNHTNPQEIVDPGAE